MYILVRFSILGGGNIQSFPIKCDVALGFVDAFNQSPFYS